MNIDLFIFHFSILNYKLDILGIVQSGGGSAIVKELSWGVDVHIQDILNGSGDGDGGSCYSGAGTGAASGAGGFNDYGGVSGAGFDVILGADLLYNRHSYRPLLNTLSSLSKADDGDSPSVILFAQAYERADMGLFESLAREAGFHLEKHPQRGITTIFELHADTRQAWRP